MEIKKYSIANDGSFNLILGMSHFIKTVDDLAEIISTTVPNAKFGIAFCEASGPCLIRHEGNDKELVEQSIDILKNIKAGHSFIILLKDCYPINILSKVKMCDEVVRIFCASANPVTVLSIEENNGASILGVIDGESPKGVENNDDIIKRRDFLKMIKYKY
jgi:adenosine/AMP kinase